MTAPDTAVPTVAVLPAVRVAAPRRAPRVKPPTKPTVIRCYRLGHHANPGKVAKVAGVLPAYQATIRAVQGDQWARWLMGGEKFWNRRDPTHIPSTLSARYKRSAQNQAVAGLDSWLEQVKPVVAGIIRNSNLPGELKADLHWLNRSAAHHKTVADIPVWDYDEHGRRTLTTGRRPAPPETLALLRRITKHVRHHRVSVPKLWRTRTMCLDGTVAQVERATDSSFDFWLRVSATTPGQVVRIPLTGNHFFDRAAGELSNFAQVTVRRDGELRVSLVKRRPPAPPREHGVDLALDWGMRSMFATDLGEQLGRSLYPWLRRVDTELTALTATLQRQGIKPSTNKRFRAMQTRIRGYVTNEVGRVVNRLVTVHQPRSITVEKLDFRDGGMSPRMNRLITRAGRAAVTRKLLAVTEDHGITVHEVNPAHTSRECAGCGYVDPRNRQGLHFRCRFCGKRLNADTNGARVIASRRSAGAADLPYGRKAVLRRADTRFETRWGLHPGQAAKLRQRPKKRRSTTPNNRRARQVPPPACEVTSSCSNDHYEITDCCR